MQTEIDFNYLDVLFALLTSTVAERGIVAGGAIRDMLLCKPIKDIDIFYTGEPTIFNNMMIKGVDELNLKYEGTEFTLTHNAIGKEEIEGVPIQFIKVEDLKTHLKTFPIALSRCSYHIYDGLVIPPEAIFSAADKTFTWETESPSYEYYLKIKEKYPEFMHVGNVPKNPNSVYDNFIQGGGVLSSIDTTELLF